MSRATRLANHIERTVTGPMWHGPALLEALNGVESDRALARPIPAAHTIWELVLHITAWCDIARQRINGQATGDPTPEQDWPPVAAALPPSAGASTTDAQAAWRRAIEQMTEPSPARGGDQSVAGQRSTRPYRGSTTPWRCCCVASSSTGPITAGRSRS